MAEPSTPHLRITGSLRESMDIACPTLSNCGSHPNPHYNRHAVFNSHTGDRSQNANQARSAGESLSTSSRKYRLGAFRRAYSYLAELILKTIQFISALLASLPNVRRRPYHLITAYGGQIFTTTWKILTMGFNAMRTAIMVYYTMMQIMYFVRFGLNQGNLVTYSEHFERDLMSYLFQNSPALLQRHREIVSRDGYFLDPILLEAQDMPLIERIFPIRLAAKSAYNGLASILVTNCTAENYSQQCTLTRSGLIFKFSDVISKHFPSLSAPNKSWPLISSTMAIYLTYSIIGILVSLFVAVICGFHLVVRIMMYGEFFKRLALIISSGAGATM